MPYDEESRRHGQSLLDGIDAALARNTEHPQTALRTIAGPVEPRADPPAQTAEVENPDPPVIGMTDEQLIRQGAQLRSHGLL